jgi:azurin
MKISNWTGKFWMAVAALGISSVAGAANCEISIVSNDAMQYNLKQLAVDASCKEIKLTLTHSGKMPKNAMGHNWVLTAESDMNSVIAEGIKAGPGKNYLPEDKTRIVAATKLLGGGESDTITFSAEKLKKDQKYVYFCSFPGHSSVMKGSFSFK